VTRPSFYVSLRTTAVLTAIAGAAIGIASGPAAAKAVEFRGSGYLRNFSEECERKGFSGPVYVNTIYRPARLGTNGKATQLSFFFPEFYAVSYELPRGRFGKNFKRVVGGATGVATHFFDSSPEVRMTAETPKRVRGNTPAAFISGEIRNFDGIEGCLADFELSLRRQP